MSYILEALRKAEQQRKQGDVPGIDDVQSVEAPVRQKRIWGWVLLGAMNIVLLAILFWPDAEQTGAESVLANNNDKEIIAPPEAPPPQVATPPQQPAFVTQAEPRYEAAESLDISPPLRSIPPPPPPVAKKVTKGRVVHAESIIEPEPEVAAKPADSTDLPAWPQIPARLLGQLGDGLRLDVHVYAERAEERFVLINLQKYREGDQLSEGPTLEEVTPGGAVLSYEGERFRIDAN